MVSEKMSRYFFISGCVAAFFHFAGVTSAEALAWVNGFLPVNRVALPGGVVVLICAALVFGGVGFFNILFVMAKAVYGLAQFLLCAMSVALLIFWFDLGVNFWLEEGGFWLIVLYAWLYGAAFSLWVFDFNYPLRNTLLAYSALPFVCLAVVWASDLIRVYL
ncbi:MAG: hypothetical protein A2505_04245 [Deltaproteobacteria bacterium RIFOXYD12_FULL_55_16]|nr:MAG: hypothetical protein A2505_04245 [Deltaproteobacteria bacterium RIFOXYD12_FULL_55_16]